MAKLPKDTAITEQYFGHVAESIQMVVELTGRIDERVKMLVDKQNQIDEQINRLLEIQNKTINRLSILEAKDLDSVVEDLQKIHETLAVINNDDASGEIQTLKDQVNKIDFRIQQIESKTTKDDKFWEKIFDGFFKITIMLIGTYIIYKLGIQ